MDEKLKEDLIEPISKLPKAMQQAINTLYCSKCALASQNGER